MTLSEEKRSLRAALVLPAGLALLHMPSGLPAPLYPLYQSTMGIDSTTVSLLFAAYVAGVMIGLMLMPLIAGYRSVLVWTCGLSIVADVLFLVAHTEWELYGGHLLQGIVLGVFTGVVPVVLAQFELSGSSKLVGRATTSANAIGLAAGPAWSGLLLEIAPWQGRLVWVIQIIVTLAVMPFMRTGGGGGEKARRKGEEAQPVRLRAVLAGMFGDLASRGAILAGFGAFVAGGLMSALGTLVIHRVVGVQNSLVEGTVVSMCFVLSAVFGALRIRRSDVSVTGQGLAWLFLGSLALGVTSVFTHLSVIVLATVLLGIGQGLGLQGATQIIAVHQPEATRGAAVSFFFILCYFGTTAASLGIGAVIPHTGLGPAFSYFSVANAALCLAGLMLCVLAGRRMRAAAVRGERTEAAPTS
ncbi:MFS transporter [Streptomyces sp. NBRC 110611]|uniref:MFS transporter n=1 Tax=Streptomyces sp. NBRC 110611 TaxID=1621259 RepID=UPI0008326DD9|nr:MFS transporter [Streptomyces sp. NBRC 110611]